MSEEEWYVTNGEWRMGPLTADDAVEVLGRAHAPGSVLVWKEGLEGWTRPELVAELTATAAGRPPARPAARPGTAMPDSAADATAAAAGGPPAPWFRVGTSKFLLMCVVTFGLYEIYWFYQQWRHVQRRGESVHPALRTLFAGFFCYALVPPRVRGRDRARRGGAVGARLRRGLRAAVGHVAAPGAVVVALAALAAAARGRAAHGVRRGPGGAADRRSQHAT